MWKKEEESQFMGEGSSLLKVGATLKPITWWIQNRQDGPAPVILTSFATAKTQTMNAGT
jgi:hypothetical protein